MSSNNEKPEGFLKGMTRLFLIPPIKKLCLNCWHYWSTNNQMQRFEIHQPDGLEDLSSKSKTPSDKKSSKKKASRKKSSRQHSRQEPVEVSTLDDDMSWSDREKTEDYSSRYDL